MPIELIDKIIPKNNAKFKLIDAKDVAINGSDVENYFQKIEILIDETKKEAIDISKINTQKIEEANEKKTLKI
ncbi:hypothetical protein H8J86_08495 [Clostridium perfringens]|uniref:hypothetical protein n=1 Tax=Clostridium perfringens TaxID=1502 RepID=UPI0018E3FFE7|nr:hypothetical protein [Clostridium perfringens]MBI6005993.1 hypothetical protein [Clostridium perfringens]